MAGFLRECYSGPSKLPKIKSAKNMSGKLERRHRKSLIKIETAPSPGRSTTFKRVLRERKLPNKLCLHELTQLSVKAEVKLKESMKI